MANSALVGMTTILPGQDPDYSPDCLGRTTFSLPLANPFRRRGWLLNTTLEWVALRNRAYRLVGESGFGVDRLVLFSSLEK